MQIDSFGIGAARSETTCIFNTLGQHPDICLFDPKDIQYFTKQNFSNSASKLPDKTNMNYYKPVGWYLNHLRHCSTESIKGEFSAAYFYDLHACERIRQYFPDAKLVLNFRNTVDSIYSAYWYRREYGKNEKEII